jgi:hypothetical protein
MIRAMRSMAGIIRAEPAACSRGARPTTGRGRRRAYKVAEFHGIAFLADLRHYIIPGGIIRGGIDGRERLRVIARGMGPTTSALFDRVGIAEGLASREEVVDLDPREEAEGST